MKLLVLLAIVIGTGIVLSLGAIISSRSEITTTPKIMPEEKEETIAGTSQQSIIETTEQPITQEDHATELSACEALEQIREEELEDAETNLNRKNREYEKAERAYDGALTAGEENPDTLTSLRKAKGEAKKEREEAEQEYRGAQKRLTAARQECGLFQ
jgi:hypothetical protein